jgi:hypothetical protein
MFDRFSGAVAEKAGSAVGDVLEAHIKTRVIEMAPELPESEVDAITRRVRNKMAEIDRMERAGNGTWNVAAGGVGLVLGFCFLWGVVRPSSRERH